MVAIRTSLHGRLAGLGHDDAPIFKGDNITFDNDGTPITIPRSDLQKLVSSSSKYVAGGATLSLTKAAHNGKVILWDTAAGSVLTLPASDGSGARFRCLVSLLATSNSHIVKVANATDVMRGLILGSRVDSGNAVLGFAAASTSDTITLNRTTTGSVSLGEYVDIEDYAAGFWLVSGVLSATGAAFATPFSATV